MSNPLPSDAVKDKPMDCNRCALRDREIASLRCELEAFKALYNYGAPILDVQTLDDMTLRLGAFGEMPTMERFCDLIASHEALRVKLLASRSSAPSDEPTKRTVERRVCVTMDEYREARAEWWAAGGPKGPGGRAAAPVYSPPDCSLCGKMRVEAELFPAFKPLDGFCLCPEDEPSRVAETRNADATDCNTAPISATRAAPIEEARDAETACPTCGHPPHGECCDACNGSGFTGPDQRCQWCNFTPDAQRSAPPEQAPDADELKDLQRMAIKHGFRLVRVDFGLPTIVTPPKPLLTDTNAADRCVHGTYPSNTCEHCQRARSPIEEPTAPPSSHPAT